MRPSDSALAFVDNYSVEETPEEFSDLYATLTSSPECLMYFPGEAIYLLIDRCENPSASLHFVAWKKSAPHHFETATRRAAELARARGMTAVDFSPPAATIPRAEIERLGYRYVLSTYDMTMRVPTAVPRIALPGGYRFAALGDEKMRSYFEAAQAAFRDSPETRIPDFAAFSERTRALTTPPELLLHGETVAGFTKVLPRGEIVTIGVVPPFRGKKLGKALAYRALEILQANAVTEASLTVLHTNRAALSLYEKMGFQKKSERATYARPV